MAQQVIQVMVTMAGWWFSYPSEKYESVGMMMIPNIGKNDPFMFQTTNQL